MGGGIFLFLLLTSCSLRIKTTKSDEAKEVQTPIAYMHSGDDVQELYLGECRTFDIDSMNILIVDRATPQTNEELMMEFGEEVQADTTLSKGLYTRLMAECFAQRIQKRASNIYLVSEKSTPEAISQIVKDDEIDLVLYIDKMEITYLFHRNKKEYDKNSKVYRESVYGAYNPGFYSASTSTANAPLPYIKLTGSSIVPSNDSFYSATYSSVWQMEWVGKAKSVKIEQSASIEDNYYKNPILNNISKLAGADFAELFILQ